MLEQQLFWCGNRERCDKSETRIGEFQVNIILLFILLFVIFSKETDVRFDTFRYMLEVCKMQMDTLLQSRMPNWTLETETFATLYEKTWRFQWISQRKTNHHWYSSFTLSQIHTQCRLNPHSHLHIGADDEVEDNKEKTQTEREDKKLQTKDTTIAAESTLSSSGSVHGMCKDNSNDKL